jgi:hypothetical protein
MKTSTIIAAAGSALLLSATASAQVQGQQQGDVFSQLLGALFGSNQQASEQTLESDWNQGRRPFEQRREALDARIDAAVRDGSLSRGEADQMRREYDDIVRLEAQYSADGNVSQQQRSDLRMRYRALTQRVSGQGGYQGNNQGGYQASGSWQPLAMRSGEFEQRIAAGLRNRTLSQADATRLRSDWRNLAQVEASYQRNGIDSREQADLRARYNIIDSRLGGSFGGGFGNDRNTARWSQMETRVLAAERNGSLDRNVAVQVRAQLSDLARLNTAYSAGGYTADERSYLMRRYNELDAMLGNIRR